MNTLLIEILACLFAAAFLSLFIGWAIRSVLATREVNAANASWGAKHSELELRYKQDTEHLEDRVEQLDNEATQLAKRNESLSESLRENELSVHKARTDSIELNRQQADTQERLQRIIAQKDEELKRLRESAASVDSSNAAIAGGISGAALSADAAEAKIATLSAKREAWEAERQRLINSMGDDQATIVIDPADLPAEPLDQTVRIDTEQISELQRRGYKTDEPQDADSDKTLTLDDDQTMLLDDNTMNTNRLQTPPSKNISPGGYPDDNDD